jgi:hypothetical protein
MTDGDSIPGVTFLRQRGKWRARIKIGATERHLGMFDTIEEAVAVREAAQAEAVSTMRGMSHISGTSAKRVRANPFAIQARRDDIFAITEEIQPCSVRQAFYQCVARGVLEKTEQGYAKVQRELVAMRREGRIPYGWITDGTRWRFKPTTFDSIEEALQDTARVYRKALWRDIDAYVEVWLEKDALSGVVNQITNIYVGLHVARGFSSLSFLAESAEDIVEIDKPTFIYHLGDHDPSGRNAGDKIEQTLREMAPNADITFERLAVTVEQIAAYDLPLRPTKKDDPRFKKFEAQFGAGSVELDALHPDVLRRIVREAIERHMDSAAFRVLKVAEESERRQLTMFVKRKRKAR